MEKVSVVIPVYQNEKSIGQCIDSLYKQTWKNLEIIIIDDGSTDNTLKVLQHLSLNKKNTILIHQENMGVSAARNRGVEVASGEYLTFVDADDLIEEEYIQVLMDSMKKENTDLVIDNIWPAIKNKDCHNYKIKNLSPSFPYLYRKYCFHNVWGKLYKTVLAKQILFNNKFRMGEDLLYNLDYLKLINTFTLIHENGYKYIENINSATHSYRKGDFNNQKQLNEASISFYKDFLNGDKKNISIIEQVFSKNVLLLILTVISSKNLKNDKKLSILRSVIDNPYFFNRLKVQRIDKKLLELIRLLFIYRKNYVLLIFGIGYRISKQLK